MSTDNMAVHAQGMTAEQALEKMKRGNQKYRCSTKGSGDISPLIRKRTAKEGQQPYAIVIACSDSRVIPESIFSAGIGELFVIRVAGNVIDNHQLGSIQYAAEHLGVKLIVVLGHTSCGAVGAAIASEPDGYVKFITDEIREAIGDEKDDFKASCLNVERSAARIAEALEISGEDDHLQVVGAVYHLEDGRVEFF